MTEPDAPAEPDLPEPPPPGQRVNRYGRSGALTQDLQDKIVRVIRAGNYLKVAAQFNGIGESTLKGWLTRGRRAAAAAEAHPPGHLHCPGCDADRTAAVRALTEGEVLNRCPSCHSTAHPQEWELPEEEGRYLDFLAAVTQAETAAEVAAVTHWRAAFPNDWRAARDYLRYTQPDRWSPVTRVSVTPEEADRRIEQATTAVLTQLGVDTDAYAGDLLMAGDLDPDSAPLDGGPLPGLGAEDDDDWLGDGDA